MLPRTNLSDIELASALAEGAGQILVAARNPQLLTGYALGATGDQLAQQWIAAVLHAHRPFDGVRSEEAPDSANRARTARVWIIDPLDGTREYASNRRDFAVHIALTVGGKPTDCAVSLPASGEIFRTDTVKTVSGKLSGKIVASRYGPTYETAWVAKALDLEPVVIGSAGAKAMAVVRGEVDAYVHASGQYEWDNCAPVGVAQAAGLHCSGIDGSTLKYNNDNPFQPHFVICRKELAAPILEALAQIL